MYTKTLNVLVIVLAAPMLIGGGFRLVAGLQHQRPLSAVITMTAVVITGLLLLAAGGLGLRSGRDPDLRLVIAGLIVMTLNSLFN